MIRAWTTCEQINQLKFKHINNNHISILTYIWWALILSWLRSDACLTLITAPSYDHVFVKPLILPLPYDEWAIFRHQVFSRCCTLNVFLYVVGLNSGTEVPTSLFQWVACTASELRHSVGCQNHQFMKVPHCFEVFFLQIFTASQTMCWWHQGWKATVTSYPNYVLLYPSAVPAYSCYSQNNELLFLPFMFILAQ